MDTLGCRTLIDQRLKEYIYSQQTHFRQKIDHQLSKFKENIHAKQIDYILFNDNLTSNQKAILHRLMTIQDEQLQSWKEFLILEQRILSKFLPENFDELENFITSNFYSSIIDDVDDDSIVK
ncbi:unnamed protein product [Rotaria socialis]